MKQMYELGFVFSKPLNLPMLARGLEYFAAVACRVPAVARVVK